MGLRFRGCRGSVDAMAILLIALALLAAAPTAEAFSAHRIGDAVAKRYWGKELPCRFIRHDVRDGWLEADDGTGHKVRVIAWVDGRPCTITWSGAWLNSPAPNAEARHNRRLAICNVYVHEAGHLAEKQHTTDGGIMHHGSPRPPFAPCVRAVEWIEAWMVWKGYEP